MLSAKRICWFFGLVLVVLIIFLPRYTKLQELKDKNRELEAKINKVKLENAVLENELRRIRKDPVYQEEIIRDKFGVVRKGEVVYKIEGNSSQ